MLALMLDGVACPCQQYHYTHATIVKRFFFSFYSGYLKKKWRVTRPEYSFSSSFNWSRDAIKIVNRTKVQLQGILSLSLSLLLLLPSLSSDLTKNPVQQHQNATMPWNYFLMDYKLSYSYCWWSMTPFRPIETFSVLESWMCVIIVWCFPVICYCWWCSAACTSRNRNRNSHRDKIEGNNIIGLICTDDVC